jgi:hypothetical protein
VYLSKPTPCVSLDFFERLKASKQAHKCHVPSGVRLARRRRGPETSPPVRGVGRLPAQSPPGGIFLLRRRRPLQFQPLPTAKKWCSRTLTLRSHQVNMKWAQTKTRFDCHHSSQGGERMADNFITCCKQNHMEKMTSWDPGNQILRSGLHDVSGTDRDLSPCSHAPRLTIQNQSCRCACKFSAAVKRWGRGNKVGSARVKKSLKFWCHGIRGQGCSLSLPVTPIIPFHIKQLQKLSLAYAWTLEWIINRLWSGISSQQRRVLAKPVAAARRRHHTFCCGNAGQTEQVSA